jgi:hypothetical protein
VSGLVSGLELFGFTGVRLFDCTTVKVALHYFNGDGKPVGRVPLPALVLCSVGPMAVCERKKIRQKMEGKKVENESKLERSNWKVLRALP